MKATQIALVFSAFAVRAAFAAIGPSAPGQCIRLPYWTTNTVDDATDPAKMLLADQMPILSTNADRRIGRSTALNYMAIFDGSLERKLRPRTSDVYTNYYGDVQPRIYEPHDFLAGATNGSGRIYTDDWRRIPARYRQKVLDEVESWKNWDGYRNVYGFDYGTTLSAYEDKRHGVPAESLLVPVCPFGHDIKIDGNREFIQYENESRYDAACGAHWAATNDLWLGIAEYPWYGTNAIRARWNPLYQNCAMFTTWDAPDVYAVTNRNRLRTVNRFENLSGLAGGIAFSKEVNFTNYWAQMKVNPIELPYASETLAIIDKTYHSEGDGFVFRPDYTEVRSAGTNVVTYTSDEGEVTDWSIMTNETGQLLPVIYAKFAFGSRKKEKDPWSDATSTNMAHNTELWPGYTGWFGAGIEVGFDDFGYATAYYDDTQLQIPDYASTGFDEGALLYVRIYADGLDGSTLWAWIEDVETGVYDDVFLGGNQGPYHIPISDYAVELYYRIHFGEGCYTWYTTPIDVLIPPGSSCTNVGNVGYSVVHNSQTGYVSKAKAQWACEYEWSGVSHYDAKGRQENNTCSAGSVVEENIDMLNKSSYRLCRQWNEDVKNEVMRSAGVYNLDDPLIAAEATAQNMLYSYLDMLKSYSACIAEASLFEGYAMATRTGGFMLYTLDMEEVQKVDGKYITRTFKFGTTFGSAVTEEDTGFSCGAFAYPKFSAIIDWKWANLPLVK